MLDQAATIGSTGPWSGARQMRCSCPSQAIVRRRRVPVRRHVLPGQGERVRKRGGCSGRRRFHFQRLGSNRGERILDGRDRSAGDGFPDDPPRFMARTPHGYYDKRPSGGTLRRADSRAPRFLWRGRSRAASARIPAIAYCQGTPLRSEIEARDASRLDEATEVGGSIAARFGRGAVDGKIQAHVTVSRA